MKDKNLNIDNPGRNLLIKMDLLKRCFGITARQIYSHAKVDECFANNVLHGRRPGAPTLLKIDSAIHHFSRSKGFFGSANRPRKVGRKIKRKEEALRSDPAKGQKKMEVQNDSEGTGMLD